MALRKGGRRNLCLLLFLMMGFRPGVIAQAQHQETNGYRVAQRAGVWWFVAPDGKPLFSLGVCCVGTGAARDKYRADRPEYAAFQHYPSDSVWAQSTLARLRAWNFNTLGGWCDTDTLLAVPGETMPYTHVLHLGASLLAPWCDLFAADMPQKFDALAKPQILARRNDTRLLGYFSDNELGWWDDTIFLFFLKQPPANATRRVLIGLLHTHYHNDFKALQRDFSCGEAKHFDDLEQNARLTLRRKGRGMEVVNEFTYRLARRYYQLAHDAIRRYDPNHLLLGDRYAGYCPTAVAKAARDYVDVVSTNYGADWNDGGNARFFLERLHRVTGKPVLITEFYFCARENRSGNKNSSAGFPTVQTQRERAAGLHANLSSLVSLPYVIGAHWFQYYDEPMFGRGDGENYNMGLVDIHDRPYEELTQMVAKLPIEAMHQTSADTPPPQKTLPHAPQKPYEGLHVWDKRNGFVRSKTTLPCADLYACWDAKHLYLAMYAGEFADTGLYPNGKMPSEERVTWTIMSKQAANPIRVRFGQGGKIAVEGITVPCREWSGATRYTAMISLPPSFFGKTRLQSGDSLTLRAVLTRHSRAERMEWQTTLSL